MPELGGGAGQAQGDAGQQGGLAGQAQGDSERGAEGPVSANGTGSPGQGPGDALGNSKEKVSRRRGWRESCPEGAGRELVLVPCGLCVYLHAVCVLCLCVCLSLSLSLSPYVPAYVLSRGWQQPLPLGWAAPDHAGLVVETAAPACGSARRGGKPSWAPPEASGGWAAALPLAPIPDRTLPPCHAGGGAIPWTCAPPCLPPSTCATPSLMRAPLFRKYSYLHWLDARPHPSVPPQP
jgi:hypothetical protein